jgi:hypothetical protein
MQMAPSIVSLQTLRHKTNPHAYTRRVGHPSFLNVPVYYNSGILSSVDAVKWKEQK